MGGLVGTFIHSALSVSERCRFVVASSPHGRLARVYTHVLDIVIDVSQLQSHTHVMHLSGAQHTAHTGCHTHLAVFTRLSHDTHTCEVCDV